MTSAKTSIAIVAVLAAAITAAGPTAVPSHSDTVDFVGAVPYCNGWDLRHNPCPTVLSGPCGTGGYDTPYTPPGDVEAFYYTVSGGVCATNPDCLSTNTYSNSGLYCLIPQ